MRESKLATNIRLLRKAYGETQEDLAVAIGVEKNTISNYEKGIRQPDRDILNDIAKHFVLSIEELLYSDLSNLGKITIDNYAIWKNIDIMLPIVSTEEALKNDHFLCAYKYHMDIYKDLQSFNMDGIDNVDKCFAEYIEAYEDETVKEEAAANYLAIWTLMLMMIKIPPAVLEDQSAALLQVASRDSATREVIDNVNPNFKKEAQALAEEFTDPEIIEVLDEFKMVLKHSMRWADLADYYLALQYVMNFVDNGLGWDFNRRIGVEMLNAFISVGNVYAAKYIKFIHEVMGLSSQSVNDKQ